MIITQYKVNGMTCMGCVASVKKMLEGMEGVSGVLVNLQPGSASIQSENEISLTVLQQVLGQKYEVFKGLQTNSQEQFSTSAQEENALSTSPWKQLTPLYLIFSFIIGGIFLTHWEAFMNRPFAEIAPVAMLDFMALFYLVFSFFKFLDLKGFPASFAMYDPLAKRWSFYGKMYPFIELGLGILLLTRQYVPVVLVVTLIILGLTTVGVVESLLNKRKISCACLGTALKLPMTQATFIENTLMIVMALYMLL